MSVPALPALPASEPGEVLAVCTWYDEGAAQWGDLLADPGGRRDGDVLTLGGGAVRLRLAEDPAWDYLHGGRVPALVRGGHLPPVAILADLSSLYGAGPLLVDLTGIPGRGVRVAQARLGGVLAGLLGGTLSFDDLVLGMDVAGEYEGDSARPAFPAPTRVLRRSFPALPSSPASLLVRTSFDDEQGWRALLDELGGADADGWVGSDLDPDEIDVEHYPLEALVVDDRAFEGLLPAQVPALTPAPVGQDQHTPLVLLADERTFTEPGRPLAAVDLFDIPGHHAVLPCDMAGSLACNLELANMDFRDFVAVAGERPWWHES